MNAVDGIMLTLTCNMMRTKRITPQERKIRTYTRQRKNSYGENDKSSRQALRKRKRWVNRSHRRAIHNIVKNGGLPWDVVDAEIKNARRHNWKKCPDKLIIGTFMRKWCGSSRTRYKPPSKRLRDEALRRLRRAGKKVDL